MNERRLRAAEEFVAAEAQPEACWEEWEAAWEAILERIEAVLPKDLAVDAPAPDDTNEDEGDDCPGIERWLQELYGGDGRVPETMPPDGARRLFEALAQPIGGMLIVCKTCGLPRPTRPDPPPGWYNAPPGSAGAYDWKQPFDVLGSCPACGAVEWSWCNQTDSDPWRELKDGRMPVDWIVQRNRLMWGDDAAADAE